jgi:signal transduction histidine kinase/ActR/RegA family two-component response regulator
MPTLLHISIAISSIFSLLVAVMMIVLVIPRQTEVVEARLDEAARQSLGGLATTIIDPLLTRQYEFLYYRLDTQLASDPTWQRMRVVDTAGEQIYPLGEWTEDLESFQTLVSAPVGNAATPLARIDLIIDHSKAFAEALALTYKLLLLLFVLVAITLFVAILFLQSAISKPVRELTTAFKKMAKGDFAYSLPVARSREISYLIREFFRFRRTTQAQQKKLVQLKEDAEKANKAKSRFMSRMSHELRTPLNSVLGFSELGLNSEKLSAEHRRQFEAINQSGHHLLELVNEILDLSRLESGSLQVTLQPVYLPDILDQCQSMTSHFAASHDVSLIVLPLAPDVCCVQADPLRLKQVIINLLSNAIKYNRKGGRVYIEVDSHNPATVSIRVRDTGIGFSQEEAGRIFAPFERLSQSATSIDGTGIGLTISQRIVDLMQGSIEVESVKGTGSEFSITLQTAVVSEEESKEILDKACCKPVAMDKSEAPGTGAATMPAAANAEASATPIAPNKALKILVAEDNEINQLLFQTQLESLGYHCTLVSDGLKALDALSANRFDILLTDISMPEMGGIELTEMIRRGDSALADTGGALPIVACSANAMTTDRDLGLAAGVDAYLTKPFQKVQLAEVLEKALAMKRSSAA